MAWAAGWNAVAVVVVGTAIADTVGRIVSPTYTGPAAVFAALLAAIVCNTASWRLGLRASSSPALVGGLAGAGLAAGGPAAVRGDSIVATTVFIVVSPVAGLLLGALVRTALRGALRRVGVLPAESRFRGLRLVSSAAISLAHGGNDVQKTMGVVAARLVSTGHLQVVVLAYAAIAAGTLSGGWRIVRTRGSAITRLWPVRRFAAETAAAVAVFGSTAVDAQVSTTHPVAGAITGVGTADRGATVHWSMLGRLAVAWLVTPPAARHEHRRSLSVPVGRRCAPRIGSIVPQCRPPAGAGCRARNSVRAARIRVE